MDYKKEIISSGSLMNNASKYNELIFKKISKYIKGITLEFGAGTGNFSEMISKKVPELIVIDEKQKSIDFLNKRLNHLKNIKIHNSNLENLQISNCDTVILLNVLEHIENDQNAIQKLMSFLNKDGYLIIQVPALNYLFSEYDRMVGHYKRYEKNDIIKICENLKLDLKDLYYFNPIGALGWWYNYCYKKKTEKNDEEKNDTINQLKIYDKYIVPLINVLDTRFNPFGISLFAIIKK